MNMFKATKAQSIKEYIDSLPDERKKLILTLHEFIQKTVPSLKPHFASNMIGYGSFPYRNYKKEMIEWPVVSLANQKNYISIYVCAVDHGKYIAEQYAKELGDVSVGKSCIRFKKLSDLNLEALQRVLIMAQKKPGFDQEQV